MLSERSHEITQSQVAGTIMVALSGMCYGFMSYFGTKLFHLNFSVTNMLFWRFFIATFFLLLISPFRKRALNPSIPLYSTLIIFLIGTMSYSLTSGLYFLACKQINTSIAMVVFFSFPVFVTLFSWLFDGWKWNAIALISLSAVLMGLAFLKGPTEAHASLSGVLLALTAAFFFAIYIYGSKLTTKIMDANFLSLLVCVGNTLIYFLLALHTHTFALPHTLNAWLYICAIGIIATALPLQLLLDGLKFVSPIKASILSVLEPVVTVIAGVVLLNETMSHMQVFGVMIVLLGAILIQFEDK